MSNKDFVSCTKILKQKMKVNIARFLISYRTLLVIRTVSPCLPTFIFTTFLYVLRKAKY